MANVTAAVSCVCHSPTPPHKNVPLRPLALQPIDDAVSKCPPSASPSLTDCSQVGWGRIHSLVSESLPPSFERSESILGHGISRVLERMFLVRTRVVLSQPHGMIVPVFATWSKASNHQGLSPDPFSSWTLEALLPSVKKKGFLRSVRQFSTGSFALHRCVRGTIPDIALIQGSPPEIWEATLGP